ncbi:MAG: hypothetical protein DMF24_07050 [Verrucomicrobia bacterium]|nr:MAG: hypothetical protein DMF24_07050 [Verrucomicrobiota bacterium]
MAFDTARHQVVLFGGVKAAGLNDTWAWNGEVWTQLEDIGRPHARTMPTSTRTLVLFSDSLNRRSIIGFSILFPC